MKYLIAALSCGLSILLAPAASVAEPALAEGTVSRSFHAMTPTGVRRFESSVEAQDIVNRVVQYLPLWEPVEAFVTDDPADVPNAEARITAGNKRTIGFNRSFMRNVQTEAGNYWALIGVASHEIGHHVGNHNFLPTDCNTNNKLELEADFHAGFALGKMGVKLDEATSTLRTFPIGGGCSHPSRDKRILVLGQGWRQATGVMLVAAVSDLPPVAGDQPAMQRTAVQPTDQTAPQPTPQTTALPEARPADQPAAQPAAPAQTRATAAPATAAPPAAETAQTPRVTASAESAPAAAAPSTTTAAAKLPPLPAPPIPPPAAAGPGAIVPKAVKVATAATSTAQAAVAAVAKALETRRATTALDQFKTRKNRDVYGNDLEKFPGLSRNDCAAKCLGNQKCKGFSFEVWNGWCFLKDDMTTSVLDPASLIAVRNGKPFPNVATGPAELFRLRGKKFVDEPISTQTVANYEGCMSSCDTLPACVALTHEKQTNSCNLFATTLGYYYDEKFDSGFKRQKPPSALIQPAAAAAVTARMEIRQNNYFKGDGYAKHEDATRADCDALCLKDANCKATEHIEKQKVCRLYAKAESSFETPGTNVAYKLSN